jgi:hypothetical protein
MAAQSVVSVNCPNCRTPFTAPIQDIVDAQANPAAKSHVLTGQLNTIVCPQCGFRGTLNAPFLYHDAELEIAFVYAPMDSGMTNVDQQRAIGDLTNRLVQSLPVEARKGYLLQPRTFITRESLVEAILERDEPTREMIESQQRKVELLEQLRKIDPQDTLAVASFVGANDQELDEMFFQLMDIVISVAENQGRTAEHERLAQHRTHLMEKSTTGRLYRAQEDAVQALMADPTRETLLAQLIAADAAEVREALVATGRQLLDYVFFQALTARIQAAEEAGDTAAQEKLVALRKEVQEIRDKVDAALAEVWNARAELLQALLMSENPQELVLRHLPELDAIFFNVLGANIRQASVEGRQDVVQRLSDLGDMIVELLQEMAPPEIRLLNQLITAEDDEQVHQLLEDGREQLNEDFIALVERAVQDLLQEEESAERQERIERLRYAADQAKALIA